MRNAVFIGTFDPFHGAHLGQILRADKYKPLGHVYVLVDQHPDHKPHATAWEHRLAMAELTLASYKPPFTYTVLPVTSSLARGFDELVDYKITGIDSLLDNLSDPERWKFAERWPMLVLSVPGIRKTELTDIIATLPPATRSKIRYEYVDRRTVPAMNYDFDRQKFIARRIHATHLRGGKDRSLIPDSVKSYIRKHRLYEGTS